MKCGVIIVAAGRGTRLGHPIRKAFVPLAGSPLYKYSVRTFASCEEIVEIVLVLDAESAAELAPEGNLGAELRELGVTKVVIGGARRQDSVLSGLLGLSAETEGAMIHDAARPFVSKQTIRGLAELLDSQVGAVPVVPVTSTVKQVDDAEFVVATVDRASLRLAQTPQAGHRQALVDALQSAAKEGVEVTDDVQALERCGHKVASWPDSPWNFKVTTPMDLTLAEVVEDKKLWSES